MNCTGEGILLMSDAQVCAVLNMLVKKAKVYPSLIEQQLVAEYCAIDFDQ